MKYYIKEKAWEVIYKNLRQEKGLHTKNEEKLRFFYEAIWYVVNGDLFLPIMEIGEHCTAGSFVGPGKEFGSVC